MTTYTEVIKMSVTSINKITSLDYFQSDNETPKTNVTPTFKPVADYQ